MSVLKKSVRFVFLFLLMNTVLLHQWAKTEGGRVSGLFIVLLSLFYLIFLAAPRGRIPGMSHRLSIMMGGHEQIVSAAQCFAAEAALYIALAFGAPGRLQWQTGLLNGAVAVLLVLLLLFCGFVRIVATSTQLGVVTRLLLLLTWWIPLWNIYLFARACGLVKREYYFELAKAELNEGRKENEVCRTKYPILLVHGIFFRDWQFLNYWGRIPKELIRNGATVFYGGQQSAAPVKDSAGELADRIREIVEREGCGKVNIIAHSKGGLDSRYAISRLGMDGFVASLTTVNTPHRGCRWAEKLLKLFPAGIVSFISGRYNAVFQKLGDKNPDFYGGVCDLTASACAEFNKETPDQEGILYQSTMSKMKGMLSAGFPLFATYPLVKLIEGENDGLVTPQAAVWGTFLGLQTGSGRRGVSHGDMVDLMRENIPGFDICEFYVRIVKELKEKGL